MSDEPEFEYLPAEQYEREMNALEATRAEGGITGTVERIRSRKDVVNNFLDTFELIGGVPALAEWASHPDNRTDFYRMYARMAPSAAHDKVGDGNMKVIHVIPPGPLDE